MLKRTSLLLAAACVALGASTASADPYDHDRQGYNQGYHQSYYHRHHRHHFNRYDDRSNGQIVIGFGDVAFGYSDGYWDNGHRWHHWRRHRDFENYRDNGRNFHAWNHDRDDDNGWQRH